LAVIHQKAIGFVIFVVAITYCYHPVHNHNFLMLFRVFYCGACDDKLSHLPQVRVWFNGILK